MKRLLLLLPLALAACSQIDQLTGRDAAQPEVEAPPPLPPQVAAALPPGVPASVVTRNADGCYLITIERMDPPAGYALTDAQGNRVCDGTPVADAAASLTTTSDAPLPPEAGSITPPAPIAPPSQG